MPARSFNIDDFDAGMARSYLRRYFSLRHLDYILSRLTMGQLHIWVGNGNNGRSTLASIVSKALESMNPVILYESSLYKPDTIPSKNKLLIVEWGAENDSIPAKTLLSHLQQGRTILLMTNTLPIITTERSDDVDELFERTVVARFKTTFTRSIDDPENNKYIAETLLPFNLMIEYIKNRMPTLDLYAKPPRRFEKELEQLKLLTVYTPPPPLAEETKINSSISIILQHRDVSRPDDQILIEVDPDSDGFLVTLQQNYIGSKCTRAMDYEALGNYLKMFFSAAENDIEGYGYVQFNVPLFSSTTVPLYDAFSYVVENLGEQIGFLMEDEWPCEIVKGPYLLRV